jgi:ubiquinone/menaquinone biosynthesis C-methylase UbiE
MSIAAHAYCRLKTTKARKIFARAPESPVWLGWDELRLLQQKYPLPPNYGYDSKSLAQRGKVRATEILQLISTKKEKIDTFLELGCLDGMVSCVLQSMGKRTTAIDVRFDRFDERALREGVTFLKTDAAHLCFEDESFDFVFSYNSFEHFDDPTLVLQEATRVVKKGGYIYLSYGPLYLSPMGLHAYGSITVPYCQLLFPIELLRDFVNVNGLSPIKTYVNMWSLEEYRSLWSKFSNRLKSIWYNERFDVENLDLIIKYPSCFKSKTKCFDNLIVSSIDALFKKIS